MTSPSASDSIRGIEHVGITVPNHEEAIAFFKAAFDAEVLFSLTDKSRDPLTHEDLGPKNGLRKGTAIVAVSMLRLQNGPNVEVFEIDRPGGRPDQGISDYGISHFSVTVDDIEAATQTFADAGGTLLEGPYDLGDQEEGPGNKGQFGQAPWGLLIEFEQLPAPMDYDGQPEAKRWLPEPDPKAEEV